MSTNIFPKHSRSKKFPNTSDYFVFSFCCDVFLVVFIFVYVFVLVFLFVFVFLCIFFFLFVFVFVIVFLFLFLCLPGTLRLRLRLTLWLGRCPSRPSRRFVFFCVFVFAYYVSVFV